SGLRDLLEGLDQARGARGWCFLPSVEGSQVVDSGENEKEAGLFDFNGVAVVTIQEWRTEAVCEHPVAADPLIEDSQMRGGVVSQKTARKDVGPAVVVIG